MPPESIAVYPTVPELPYSFYVYPPSAESSFRMFSGVENDNLNPNRILNAMKVMLGIQLIERSEIYFAMLAREDVLASEWCSPEEDEAWGNL